MNKVVKEIIGIIRNEKEHNAIVFKFTFLNIKNKNSIIPKGINSYLKQILKPYKKKDKYKNNLLSSFIKYKRQINDQIKEFKA